MAFLITWLRIERSREALLWVWVVGKLGHADGGFWGKNATEELRRLFGVDELVGNAEVRVGKRTTLDHYAEAMEKAGWAGPKQTVPSFSELDIHTIAHCSS